MYQAPPGEEVSAEMPPAILRPEAALPLRFHAPAGWPEPSAWWVATHQGWTPPEGWTPPDSHDAQPVPAAGRAWTWWTRDARMWNTLTRRIVAQYRRGIVAGALVSAFALALLFSPTFDHSALRILLWGALLYGPAECARDIVGLATLGERYDAHARRRAARLATLPVDERPTSEQELAAHFMPKSGAGSDAPLAQRGRIATMVVAGALAAVLILLLADAFIGSTMGSGAR
jgi:hypothetical protein